MTYFKLSSWKLSTWPPLGREQQGRLHGLSPASCSQTHPAFQEPTWLGMPRVVKQGGCFKPAANLLAMDQMSPALAPSTRSGCDSHFRGCLSQDFIKSSLIAAARRVARPAASRSGTSVPPPRWESAACPVVPSSRISWRGWDRGWVPLPGHAGKMGAGAGLFPRKRVVEGHQVAIMEWLCP